MLEDERNQQDRNGDENGAGLEVLVGKPMEVRLLSSANIFMTVSPSKIIPVPSSTDVGLLLGAHTSIADGFDKAVQRAHAAGFTTAQIFVKNNHQWSAPPMQRQDADAFIASNRTAKILFFGHAGYLINIGTPEKRLRTKSIDALVGELLRAEKLHLPFLVLHPGNHMGSGESCGLQTISDSLNEVIRQTRSCPVQIALENTAGSGSSLGYRLEHLAHLLDQAKQPERIGVCIDTAHLFASGYDFRTRPAYEKTFSEVERLFGKRRLLAFHLNDSKTDLGSHTDRHEHIGQGRIGLTGFHCLMCDPRWERIPKVLETPKGKDMREDIENLNRLKSLRLQPLPTMRSGGNKKPVAGWASKPPQR